MEVGEEVDEHVVPILEHHEVGEGEEVEEHVLPAIEAEHERERGEDGPKYDIYVPLDRCIELARQSYFIRELPGADEEGGHKHEVGRAHLLHEGEDRVEGVEHEPVGLSSNIVP